MTAHSNAATVRPCPNVARPLAVVTVLLATVAGMPEARAELVACADTKAPIEIAVARWEKNRFVSRGWFPVPGGACRVLIRRELHKGRYYVFARERRGRRAWSKRAEAIRPICVDPARDFAHREFSSIGPRCPAGLEQRPFGVHTVSSGKLRIRIGH